MEKEKILIVDSEKDVRKSLFDCLGEKYDLFTSETCAQALEMFKKHAFNVVITGLDTPETKGIEVLRKLKESKSEIPIIIVTTYESIPLAVEAMKAGAYDYITKPFNLDELELVVNHALERQKLRQQLLEEIREKGIYQELALLDGLTKVYNRRYFEELLRRELERATRYPQKFSLLMIDIDNFKKYNNNYGHLAGDSVLKGVANIIYYRSRKTDFVARYGGEEFALIAPHMDKEGASVLAARMVDFVAEEKFVLKKSIMTKVTVSIGVATFKDDATTREKLIQTADEALYQAKKLGKNRACLFGIKT